MQDGLDLLNSGIRYLSEIVSATRNFSEICQPSRKDSSRASYDIFVRNELQKFQRNSWKECYFLICGLYLTRSGVVTVWLLLIKGTTPLIRARFSSKLSSGIDTHSLDIGIILGCITSILVLPICAFS